MRRTCGACECAPDVICDSPIETAYGERAVCPECETRYIFGAAYSDDYRVIHIVLEAAEIAQDKKERRGGVWQLDRGSKGQRVYLTCPACADIHEEPRQRVNADGFVGGRVRNSCVSCDCGLHFWPYLEGWKERTRT